MRDHDLQKLEANDWERGRAIRLRALADTPEAFAATLHEEKRMPEEIWKTRLARSDAATFVACDDTGDIGLAVAAPYDEFVGLYSMWVAPEARGRGVGGSLVEAVLAWSLAREHQKILLDVGDDNAPAIALYKHMGFLPTGVTSRLPPPRDHIAEHQMARVLMVDS